MLDSGLVNRRAQIIRPSDWSRITLDDLPSARQKWELTPESFEALLLWLDPDREHAGEKYEEIRSTLISRFWQLGCREPEELANETFDRVAKKLPEIVNTYKGDRTPYFFSVAHYVHMEQNRRLVVVQLPDDYSDGSQQSTRNMLGDDDELIDSCLEHCMRQLTDRSREMILQYYSGEREVKIKVRKELAEQMGIKLANLRLKAQRVRADLKKCILDCMERQTAM